MGRGKGGHTSMKTYTRDEGSSGGEIYTQTNTQTHIQKHTQTYVQTHTQTHTQSSLHLCGADTNVSLRTYWTTRELAVAK